ncbi:MAG: helix-turn-helix domain-containing protein [Bacteroidia bacterium]
MQKPVTDTLVLFGLMVKKARLENNWSQTELAAKVDMDMRTIQRIERGETNLRFHNLYSLIDVLDIDPNSVFKRSASAVRSSS